MAADSRNRAASAALQIRDFGDRGTGMRTRAATLRWTSSSRRAELSAARSTRQAWWTVEALGYWWQHLPTAQHSGSPRAASLPCAQHWQVRRSLLTQAWTSLTRSRSRRRVPISGAMYSRRHFLRVTRVRRDCRRETCGMTALHFPP
jgi:hypothetical protein